MLLWRQLTNRFETFCLDVWYALLPFIENLDIELWHIDLLILYILLSSTHFLIIVTSATIKSDCNDYELLCYLVELREVRHENVNPFIGCYTDPMSPALIYDYCTRKSLEARPFNLFIFVAPCYLYLLNAQRKNW